MFSMSQTHYNYDTYAAAPASRQYAAHGTSSAFSSSANPDEDWTKISDLAERRRIQNRIAQRNYRKKLKRRLEDLERRAGTSDGSSSATESKTPSTKSSGSKKSSKKSSAAAAPKTVQAPQFTPPMQPEDELIFGASYDERDRSHTPPYMTYSAYPPPPEEVMLAPYSSQQQYQPITTAEAYPPYTVPCTLPSMTHFSDAMKREQAYPEEAWTPFMSYGFVQGTEFQAPGSYDHHSNPHTPPLSHSFDHSTNCSESGYEYPTTPLSMPDSPPHMLGQ